MNELGFLPRGWLTYFVTLTYDNLHLPYVRYDDLVNGQAIIRRGSGEMLEDKSSYMTKWYQSIDISDYKNSAYIIKKGSGKKYKMPCDAVGVLYIRDFQLFFKRLNKNLSKKYGYSQFRFFVSYEYGENTFRPHCHILLSSPLSSETLKTAIVESWSYCDFRSLQKHLSRYLFNGKPRSWFELALRPAQYVSTYVCDGFSLPPFYKIPLWRQKKCHSLHYGFNNPAFSLSAVFDAARKNNLEYIRDYYSKDGQHHVDSVFIPNYVLRRYFPKIKRYSWASSHAFIHLCEILSGNFTKYRKYSGTSTYLSRQQFLGCSLYFSPFVVEMFYKLQYTSDDIINLLNIVWRMSLFARDLGISMYDYLLMYDSVMRQEQLRLIKKQHDDDFNFLSSFKNYDNLSFLLTKIGKNSSVSDLIFSDYSGVVHTSSVVQFCQNWIDPRRSVLLRQFADNKNIKKCNAQINSFYNFIKYGT